MDLRKPHEAKALIIIDGTSKTIKRSNGDLGDFHCPQDDCSFSHANKEIFQEHWRKVHKGKRVGLIKDVVGSSSMWLSIKLYLLFSYFIISVLLFHLQYIHYIQL